MIGNDYLQMRIFIRRGVKYLLCKVHGHKQPYFVEVWESKHGMQRAEYLCRRCMTVMGAKPYGESKS